MLIDLIGPNGKNAARIVSSFNSKDMLPTYTLYVCVCVCVRTIFVKIYMVLGYIL